MYENIMSFLFAFHCFLSLKLKEISFIKFLTILLVFILCASYFMTVFICLLVTHCVMNKSFHAGTICSLSPLKNLTNTIYNSYHCMICMVT